MSKELRNVAECLNFVAKLHNVHSMLTFKTDVLCLVSNVQLVKGFLL